jgi:hypothetical protein
MRGRVNEASSFQDEGAQNSTTIRVPSEGNESVVWHKKNRRGLSITGWLEIWYSLGGYVHNWVKWPERESDDKTLHKVEILSGAIILSLYMSVLSI